MLLKSDDSGLQHASVPYDPAKRREYYLRTRKLKGRQARSERSARSRESAPPAPPSPPSQATQAKREAARQRVQALQARLDRLDNILSQLVEAAKARSGVDTKPSADKADQKTSPDKQTKSDRKLTAKEKRDAAKRSEKYRKEHEDTGAVAKAKALEADIQDAQEKIAQARVDLKAAVARARQKVASQTSSKTAPNGR